MPRLPAWLRHRSTWIALAAGALGFSLLGVVRLNYLSRHLPLPPGVSVASAPIPVRADDVRFLADITHGDRVEQSIYDRALELIAGAEQFILVDLFLWNDYLGQDPGPPFRSLSQEMVDALLARRAARPDLPIHVISDPINEAYGGTPWPGFERLRAAGIPVTLTDHTRLRDSNPAYSAFWRWCVRPFGPGGAGSLPHPLSANAPQVSLRSWLALLNFKANHRKLIVVDSPTTDGTDRQWTTLVMSANPHDGSSRHSNVALEVRGDLAFTALNSEAGVLNFSGNPIDLFQTLPIGQQPVPPRETAATVQLVTESKIRDALLAGLATADEASQVDVAVFYLSDRWVVDALAAAANRGATVRLLLDPNKDAFGYEKNGIPNRPVAAELRRRTEGRIAVRWIDTTGEQFHAKLFLLERHGTVTLLAGSANFTSRNLGDYNLESNLLLQGPGDLPALRDARDWFERLWSNRDAPFSVAYERYADASRWHALVYRFQEATGLSTF